MYAIETKVLKKEFKDGKEVTHALNGINLEIEKNQVYGLLGPNGAGKTTTIYILSTLLTPTSGEAYVLGYNIKKDKTEIRSRVGLCFGGARFSWDLRPGEILEYYARLFGIKKEERRRRIKKLVEDMEIEPFLNKSFGDLSTGMKQKVAIAKSLINDPEVLFLDEPTAGLDVEVAVAVRKYILKLLKEREMTVILTSHHLNEVEVMCKKIAIMDKGEIIAEGNIKDIRKRVEFPDIVHLYLSSYKNLGFLDKIKGVVSYKINDGVNVYTEDGLSFVKQIEPVLNKKSIKIQDIDIRKASLEEVFLKIVGGKKKVYV